MVDPDLRDRSVLVTGGAGFIGSHLADALVPANDVTILDDLSTGRRANVPDGADLVDGSVEDTAAVERAMDDADVVFHEAAVVSVQRSVEDPTGTHGVTVDGTLNVLEAALERDARVVLASSAAIYGPPETVPIPETAPKRPTSPYGLDKLAVDRYATLYHDLYGLEAVALRYFNVYGPRQVAGDYSGVITVFVDQARRDAPITVHGDGEQTRDFVHVSDVVRANLLAATADVAGEAINVGTGEATTIERLATVVRDAVGADSEITYTDPRPGDIRHSRADVSRAREALGFRADVGLEAGIRTLLE